MQKTNMPPYIIYCFYYFINYQQNNVIDFRIRSLNIDLDFEPFIIYYGSHKLDSLRAWSRS